MRLITFIFLFYLGSVPLLSQEIYLELDEPATKLAINPFGRLHVVSNEFSCQYEGRVKIEDCTKFNANVVSIIPISDNKYVLLEQERILFFNDNQLFKIDTIDDIFTSGVYLNKKIIVGTTSGIMIYSFKNGAFEKKMFEEKFVNDLSVIDNQILAIALDNGFVLKNLETNLEKFIPTEFIVSEVEKFSKDEIIVLLDNKQLFLYNVKNESFVKLFENQFEINKVISSCRELFFMTDSGVMELKNNKAEYLLKGKFNDVMALDNCLLLAQENKILSFNLLSKPVLTNGKVFSFYHDTLGGLWLGKNKKIEYYSQNKLIKEMILPVTDENVFVSSITVNQFFIFAGTMGKGIYVFDLKGKFIKQIWSQSLLNQNNIIQLKLKNNKLWVAYLDGVLVYNSVNFELEKNYNDFVKNSYVLSMEPISDDDFFVGTSNHGIVRYDKGKITNYLENSSVYNLSAAKNGILVGTKGKGVFEIKDNKATLLKTGYQSLSLASLSDNLVLINEKNNLILFDINKDRVLSLGQNGLFNPVLNAIQTTNERTYVLFENGLMEVDNNRLKLLTKVQLHLNQPILFSTEIPLGKNKFDFHQNSFSFSYHLNTVLPETGINYKYRLFGLDTNWNNTQQNEIKFYNLPPGSYSFQVSFGYGEDFRPTQIEEFKFTISKPFWKTIWFFILMVFFIVLGVYFIVKLREKNLLKQQERERERINQELNQLKSQVDPHFLFNSFNSLIGLIEEDPKLAAKSTQRLSDLYRLLLKFQNKDTVEVWEEINLATNYYEIHKMRFENLLDLEISNIKQEGRILPFSIQFLIENAIKHNVINSSKPLHLKLYSENGYIVLKNNKNNKNTKGEKSGYGLVNLKKRYNLIGKKQVIIEDETNWFVVKIPIIYD